MKRLKMIMVFSGATGTQIIIHFWCKRLISWRYNNLQIMTYIISDNLLYLKIGQDQDPELSQIINGFWVNTPWVMFRSKVPEP